MSKDKTNLYDNQDGLVSIIVSLIIIILISLMVLGFGKLVRRDQRQALDRQLNTQAYFAAETGVNDAMKAIRANFALTTAEKTTCDDPSNTWGLNPVIDASTEVSYSCLLIDTSPTSQDFSNVSTLASRVVPLISKNSLNFTNVNISWQATSYPPAGASFNCSAAGTFPAVNTWLPCDTGVLRMDMVPFGSNKSRAQLGNENFNVFLHPGSGGQNSTVYSASQGNIMGVRCTTATTPKYCSLNVDVSGLNTNKIYLRLRSIYKDSTVTVTAFTGGGSPAELIGGQILIDSTGKASDVLRRILVRYPYAQGDLPEDAIDVSAGLCKRYFVVPGLPVSTDIGNIDDPGNPCSIR